MAKTCKCYVLNVGQGSATLLVVYDGALPVTMVLTDLGSGTSNVGSASYSLTIDLIFNELQKMPGGATLDLLVLSHSDNDHINLMGRLLDKFSPNGVGKPKLVIGRVVYGGWYGLYKKGAYNILDAITPYLKYPSDVDKTLCAAPPCASGFSGVGHPVKEDPIVDVNGLRVTVLIMNAPGPGGASFTNDIWINTRSVVVVATYTNSAKYYVNFVITGDATALTFIASRDFVFGKPNRLSDRLGGTILMAVPHHGSARTATCYTRPFSTHAAPKWEAIDNFIGDCQSQTAVASAGNTSHRHPRWSLLDRYFAPSAPPLGQTEYDDPNLTPVKGHIYTAYFDGDEFDAVYGKKTGFGAHYGCFVTTPAMYTTLYFNAPAYTQYIYPTIGSKLGPLPTVAQLSINNVPMLVYWVYEFNDASKVIIQPEKFALTAVASVTSPFVGPHPAALASAARAGLRARRISPATAPSPRGHALS